MTDTLDNADPTNNPGGEGTATWTFDVSDASALEVSIDMAAMGDFEATGTNRDRFDWTYSLDGGEFLPLFNSSVDEAASADYTLAGGATVNLLDPLSMTPTGGVAMQLSNVLQTLTAPIAGLGDSLTLRLIAKTDGTSEAYAFDNITVTGLVASFAAADFNDDGFVDGDDLATWQTNFGTPSGRCEEPGRRRSRRRRRRRRFPGVAATMDGSGGERGRIGVGSGTDVGAAVAYGVSQFCTTADERTRMMNRERRRFLWLAAWASSPALLASFAHAQNSTL